MADIEYLESDSVIIAEKVPRKYKKYEETALKEALNKILDKSLSIYGASKEYNIPESTLSIRLKKIQKDELLKKPGPENILNEEEENQLAEWLIVCAELGDPRTKDDLCHAAADIRNLRSPSSSPQFKNETPTNHWINSFLKRHPQISIRTPESLTRAAAMVPASRIERFFQNFHSFLEKENLLHVLSRPDAFYNIDETGFELNPTMKRVFAKKGAKNVYKVDASRPKLNITVCYCFGADGKMLKSQVILKKQFSRMEELAYASGSVNGNFLFTQTESGWQNKDSFEAYIHRIDTELKDVERPIFIFMDNHPSHININLFKWCKNRGINMISFPPNCTHILQMCDTSIFGPAKLGWKREVIDWKRRNGNKEVDEIEFIKILQSMNDKVINESKIINGFKGTGIYPLNIQNVHLERCIGVEHDPQNIDDHITPPQNIDDHFSSPPPSSDNLDTPTTSSSHQVSHQFNIINNQLLVPAQEQFVSLGSPALPIEKAEAISGYLSKMQDLVKPLHELLLDIPGEYVLNSMIIKQQLNILSSAFNIENHTENHIEDTFDESATSSSIKDILKPPEPIARKTNRSFKVPNYGIFTSDEYLDKVSNIQQEKEKINLEKEQKKRNREEKKKIQEAIKNMKKEIAVEKKEIREREKNAKKKIQENKEMSSKESMKKKRGRPSKKIN